MTSCFSDTAFAYAILQVMTPGERHDPEHYDGGASLLHGGLTIFGSRGLEMQTAAVAESADPAGMANISWYALLGRKRCKLMHARGRLPY